MSLSISMISNRPHSVIAFLHSMFGTFDNIKPIQLALSYQEPVHDYIDQIDSLCSRLGIGLHAEYKEFMEGKLFNYAEAREHAWSLCSNDYVFLVDDDFTFQMRTPTADFSSGDRVNDAIEFIKFHEILENQVIVQLNGFLGGSAKGRGFYPLHQDLWSLNHGIILKRHKESLIEPRLRRPGACEDLSIFATHIARGYVPYKGFQSITKTAKRKRLYTDPNPNYDYDLVVNQGNVAAVLHAYPNFPIDKRILAHP